jgi:hypothetical protein
VSGPIPSFSVFAEGWDLDVADVRGATVLYDRHAAGMGRVVGDEVQQLASPASPGALITRVVGTWPDLWGIWQDRSGNEAVVRWQDSHWAPQRTVDGANYAWVRLASGPVSASALLNGTSGGRVDLFDPGPRQTASWWDGTADRPVRGAPLFNPLGFDVTGAGDVLVLGFSHVTPLEERLWVERWPRGARTSTVEQLPGVSRIHGCGLAFCVGSEHEAYVVRRLEVEFDPEPKYKSDVVRFDGSWKVMSDLPDPADDRFEVGCAVAPDHTLWVAENGASDGSRVYRMAPDGTWSRAPVPALEALSTVRAFDEGPRPRHWRVLDYPLSGNAWFVLTGIHAAPTGEIWLVGDRWEGTQQLYTKLSSAEFRRAVVLRSGPARAGGSLLWEQVTEDPLDAEVRRVNGTGKAPQAASVPTAPTPKQPSTALAPATPACQGIFLALYAVSPSTPPDYDFPLTREALRDEPEYADVQFVEADYENRRFFGALVDDYAKARGLSRLISERVKGSQPQILCGRPAIRRTVPMSR